MKKAHYQSFILLIFLVLNSPFSYAQTDEKAENILKESKIKFESLKDYAAQFTYTLSNPISATSSVSKKGIIKIKGKKFLIQMEDQQIYCDGESQWIYLPNENEVTIMSYDPEEGLNAVESVFQLHEAYGTFKYAGIEPLYNRDHHKINLTITDGEYYRGNLWIDVHTQFPSKAVLVNRLQTTTEYLFSAIQFNQGILDSEFVFDLSKYPGIEVYDER